MKNKDDKRNIAIKPSDQNEEIVCRNGMQIITFSRLAPNGNNVLFSLKRRPANSKRGKSQIT